MALFSCIFDNAYPTTLINFSLARDTRLYSFSRILACKLFVARCISNKKNVPEKLSMLS